MFIENLGAAHCGGEYGNGSGGTSVTIKGYFLTSNAELPTEPSVYYYPGARSALGPAASSIVFLVTRHLLGLLSGSFCRALSNGC